MIRKHHQPQIGTKDAEAYLKLGDAKLGLPGIQMKQASQRQTESATGNQTVKRAGESCMSGEEQSGSECVSMRLMTGLFGNEMRSTGELMKWEGQWDEVETWSWKSTGLRSNGQKNGDMETREGELIRT